MCSTIVLQTWNVDSVGNPLLFYNLISGLFSVFLYLTKLHHFIKYCKSIVFSRLAETNENIRSNLQNINRMSRILFMKWREIILSLFYVDFHYPYGFYPKALGYFYRNQLPFVYW